MTGNQERLAPLETVDWHASLSDVQKSLGAPLNIHKVIARNAKLMMHYAPLREHVVRSSSLEPRIRELLVLRVAVRTGSEYEWIHHVERGRTAGLSTDEIVCVRDRRHAECWTGKEDILLDAVDEIIDNHKVLHTTWIRLTGQFSDEEILDVIFTTGIYLIMATILETAQVPLEDAYLGTDDPGLNIDRVVETESGVEK